MSRSVPATCPHQTLHAWDWEDLVGGRFFEQMLLGVVGVIIGLVSIRVNAVEIPNWLLIDPWLSGAGVALAFARIWKTIREEHETKLVWGSVEAANDTNSTMLDRTFEIPYLFSITVLPIAALAPQLFMAVLALFYISDNFYNAGLARGVEKSDQEQTYRKAWWVAVKRIVWLRTRDIEGGSRDHLVRYFRRRAHYDSVLLFVLVGSFVAVTALKIADSGAAAWWLALGTLLGVLLFEVFIEPMRNQGMMFAPEPTDEPGVVTVEDVESGAEVPDITVNALRRIHNQAFRPEEQQYTMDDMLEQAGSGKGQLRVISLDEEPVGYLYLELMPEKETAFLWYLAVDQHHRSRGLGEQAVRETLEMLSADQRLKYALFEVHAPREGHADDDDRRRIAFYRRLGAYWVRDVDYRIPAADNRSQSVAYDPMFFALRDGYDTAEIAERIALMAEDNFQDAPEDPRWLALRESLPNLSVVAPTDPIEPG